MLAFYPGVGFSFFFLMCNKNTEQGAWGCLLPPRTLGTPGVGFPSGIFVPLCHLQGSTCLLPAPPNLLMKDYSSLVTFICFLIGPGLTARREDDVSWSFYLSQTSLSPEHPSWLPRDSRQGGLTHLLIRRCLKPFRGAGGPWGAQGCPSYRGGEEGWGGGQHLSSTGAFFPSSPRAPWGA